MFIGIRLAPGQLLIVTASAEVLRYQSSASLSLSQTNMNYQEIAPPKHWFGLRNNLLHNLPP